MLEFNNFSKSTPEEIQKINILNRHRLAIADQAQCFTKKEIIQATLAARKKVHDTETVHHASMHNTSIPEDVRKQAEMDYLLAQITLEEYEKSIKKRGIYSPSEELKN